MDKWITRGGRALTMGLAWAAAWVPAGSLAGWLIVGELEPEWIGGPLYAGFLCGAIFSAAGGTADGHRGRVQTPLRREGARGMVSGLLAGGLWVVVALLSDPPKWVLYVVVVGSLTLLSAVSGVASALVARMLKDDFGANAA